MIDTVLQYSLSYFTVTMILVYILNIPQLVTNDKKGLIKEYYYDNFTNVIIFDYFLIALYLAAGLYLIHLFETKNTFDNIIVIALTTILISGMFALYFLSGPEDETFFSRWFHSVHQFAVVYDVILLVCVYVLYDYLKNILKY